MVTDSVGFLIGEGRRVFFDAEHFFDGYRRNPQYALDVLRAAEQAGAERLILCDTNGGTLPNDAAAAVREVVAHVSTPLGVHFHNDAGCAVANSVLAVGMGVVQVQATVNGYGERTGNADLVPIAANLAVKAGLPVLPGDGVARLTELSHLVAEVANIAPDPHQPYVGRNAFAHKAGLHVNAVLKTLYFGHGTRLATVVDKGALGYDPSVQPYPYDPNKAKALLAEAGFPNGFDVEFDSFTGSIADHSKPAEAIVGYLQKVGIRAKANVFEFSSFGPRRVQNKTAPLFIYSIGNAYLEPSWVIRWMTQGGLGMHYKNAKLDELLTRIEATDDPKRRAPQYSDVQKLLKDEAPFIFLYQADAAFGMSTRVDYTPRPDETQWLYPLGLKG